MVILRENTEGLYHSLLHRSAQRAKGLEGYEPPEIDFPGLHGEVAYDPRPISSHGSERLIKMGFDICETRNGAPVDGVSRVSCIDKSNVTRGCQLFRRSFDKIAHSYQHVEKDYGYIDAFTQWLTRTLNSMTWLLHRICLVILQPISPPSYKEGWVWPLSGNIGDNHAFFEPVHGSAPKHAGQNKVNPIASINSVQMMLDWLARRSNDDDLLDVSRILDKVLLSISKMVHLSPYDLGGECHAQMLENQLRIVWLLT